MSYLIKGNNANELYIQARNLIDSEGAKSNNTDELMHVMLELNDPRQKWVSQRRPVPSISFALAEVIWIASGDNKRDVVDFWNPKYSTYTADKGKDFYHGAYGYRLRKNFKFDQLTRAYNALKSKPQNRQTVLLYWDPTIDLPNQDGSPRSHDIPCNICSLLKIRDNKLEWMQVMRSNDIYRGLPYNFVQFTSLQEILAGWLNVDVGKYTHFSDSLHIYDSDKNTGYFDGCNEIENSDSLSISKSESDKIIPEIYSRMKNMMRAGITEKELYHLSCLNSSSKAYNNLLAIIGAYVANKMNYADLVKRIVKICDNKLYIHMWNDFLESRMFNRN